MKPSRLLTVILIATSMMLSMSAQEEPPKKMGKLEIGSGINVFGPAPQMAELMVQYRLDKTIHYWLFDGTSEHPDYGHVGLSFQISYSRYLGPGSQLGILLHYSSLPRVHGYSYIDRFLTVTFSNVSTALLYTYDLDKALEIQVGPALMINSGKQADSDDYYGIRENYTKLSPGLLFGLNVKIWDNTLTYGKISTQCLLTTRNKIGPFSVENYSGLSVTIPESKIGFSHLNFLFVFGIHL